MSLWCFRAPREHCVRHCEVSDKDLNKNLFLFSSSELLYTYSCWVSDYAICRLINLYCNFDFLNHRLFRPFWLLIFYLTLTFSTFDIDVIGAFEHLFFLPRYSDWLSCMVFHSMFVIWRSSKCVSSSSFLSLQLRLKTLMCLNPDSKDSWYCLSTALWVMARIRSYCAWCESSAGISIEHVILNSSRCSFVSTDQIREEVSRNTIFFLDWGSLSIMYTDLRQMLTACSKTWEPVRWVSSHFPWLRIIFESASCC